MAIQRMALRPPGAERGHGTGPGSQRAVVEEAGGEILGYVNPRLNRRRFLGGAGAAIAGLSLLNCSLSQGRAVGSPTEPATTPAAGDATTPAPAFEATPSATPTPEATPTPAAVTPAPARRLEWGPDVLSQVASSGPNTRPQVALTLDDDWSARDDVLRVLKDLNLRLTLFLTGRALAGDHGFIARALDAGCEIGNHTMDHYDLTRKPSTDIRKDLDDFEDLVHSVVNSATTRPFMRPSGGTLNSTVVNVAAAAGYRPILWSASTGDGSASTTPDQMVANALRGIRPGAIILMHFGPRATVALPKLANALRAGGLEPVSLTKLFSG